MVAQLRRRPAFSWWHPHASAYHLLANASSGQSSTEKVSSSGDSSSAGEVKHTPLIKGLDSPSQGTGETAAKDDKKALKKEYGSNIQDVLTNPGTVSGNASVESASKPTSTPGSESAISPVSTTAAPLGHVEKHDHLMDGLHSPTTGVGKTEAKGKSKQFKKEFGNKVKNIFQDGDAE